MGCGGSKPLPRHSDDRELDELDIQETEIADVDSTFETAYAPVVSLVEINNAMVEAADAVKTAGAAVLGAYTLRFLINQTNSVYSVQTDILDKESKELSKDAVADLMKNHAELSKQYDLLQKMKDAVNKEFEKVDKAAKKPSSVDVVKGVKILSKNESGKRFVCPPLNVAVDNMNKQAFFVVEQLQHASFKDGFSMTNALKACLDNIKAELKDKFAPGLDINTDKLMEGEVEVSFKVVEGDVDVVELLPEPSKTCYKSLMAMVEAIKKGVAELGELKPKIEAVPETIQNFDAVGAIKGAGLPPLKLPGAIKKAAMNAKLVGSIPEIVKHTPETALALLGDFQAAFKGEGAK